MTSNVRKINSVPTPEPVWDYDTDNDDHVEQRITTAFKEIVWHMDRHQSDEYYTLKDAIETIEDCSTTIVSLIEQSKHGLSRESKKEIIRCAKRALAEAKEGFAVKLAMHQDRVSKSSPPQNRLSLIYRSTGTQTTGVQSPKQSRSAETQTDNTGPPKKTPSPPAPAFTSRYQTLATSLNDMQQLVNKTISEIPSIVRRSIKEEMASSLPPLTSKKNPPASYATVTSKKSTRTTVTTKANPIATSVASTDSPITSKASPPRPRTLAPKPAIVMSIPGKEHMTRADTIRVIGTVMDPKNTCCTIMRINSLSKGKVRVEFETEEQKMKALELLSSRPPSEVTAEPERRLRPMIMIKGIPKEVLMEELTPAILEQNPELADFTSADICLKFPRNNKNPSLYNAVLQVSPAMWRTLTDMGQVRVHFNKIHLSEFLPFVQCHKCLSFGHTKNNCPKESATCAFCAESHSKEECPLKDKPDATPRCYNCRIYKDKFPDADPGHHPANSSNCPRIKTVRRKVLNKIDYGPTN